MPRQSVFDMSYGNPSASIVLIQMVDDHDLGGIESEAAEIKKLTDADFHLIAVRVQNWNRDSGKDLFHRRILPGRTFRFMGSISDGCVQGRGGCFPVYVVPRLCGLYERKHHPC